MLLNSVGMGVMIQGSQHVKTLFGQMECLPRCSSGRLETMYKTDTANGILIWRQTASSGHTQRERERESTQTHT